MKRFFCTSLALTTLSIACGPGPIDIGDSRTFHLASTTLQAFPGSDPFYRLEPRDISEDVDAVAIHQDFLGIPWQAFRDGVAPPAPWVASVDALVESTRGRPIFLSLALVNGDGRAFLDDQVSSDGLSKTPGWSQRCFDFSTDPDGAVWKDAYVAYALWMIDRFQPRWLNVAIELNVFLKTCGDGPAWRALVAAEAAIYEAIKARHPDLPVFPSLTLEDLYGLDAATCDGSASECLDQSASTFEANLQALQGLKMDRLAVSTYPFGQPSMADPADIPDDYFSRISGHFEVPLVIAETGWPAEDIRYAVDPASGPCSRFVKGSPRRQATYLRRLALEAQDHRSDLVTWWSNRDVILSGLSSSCPTIEGSFECGAHPEWCGAVDAFRGALGGWFGELVFKFFGTMGLRDYEGNLREPMATTWADLRALPLASP